MRDFIIVGLTGPTGAGKSTVAAFFKENGFIIIDADSVARQALRSESSCLMQLCSVFGDDILNSDGTVNRQALAARAFSSKEKTQLLNDITHPWIFLQVLKICRENIDNGRRCILFDAPVLFESNSDIMCDAVVSVTAPREIRLQRLIKRDGLTEKQLKSRMSAQHDDGFYSSKSDFVIDGSLTLGEIEREVKTIIAGILNAKRGQSESVD